MLTNSWEHTVSVAVMDTIGLVVNIWFLYTIKRRESPYNAIDFLQAIKTVLCLGALTVCVWLEVFTCSSLICTASKAIVDDVFIFSTCYAFLAIAYVRRKVCLCRGRASVLVTNTYAVKTLFICFTPIGMFVAAYLTLMSGGQRNSSSSDMVLNNSSEARYSELLEGHSRVAYELCHLLILIVLPLTVSTLLYMRIGFVVSQAAKTMDGSVTHRTRDPYKMIMTSVTLLLTIVLSVWGVFVIVKVVSQFMKMDEIFFLYWKITILIASPVGDGLLQQSRRKTVEKVNDVIPSRSARRVHPWTSPTQTESQAEDGYETISLAERLPVLVEEASLRASHDQGGNSNELADSKPDFLIKKRRQSIRNPRASVLIRNAAVIGLEFQEKTSFVDFVRQRKVSQEQFKADLKNIETVAKNREKTRRLSNCLRFTAVDEPTDDEIYHMYKKLYCRRGSRYSEKSAQNDDQEATPEFKALSYASLNSDKDRKLSESSSGINSPSHKRWRKLFTTARSARRFSELRKHDTGMVIEEEPTQNNTNEQIFSNINKYQHPDKPLQKLSAFSMTQHAMYAKNALERRSLDSHLSKVGKKDEKKWKTPTKKRSMSCVSNELMKEKNDRKSRKKSVTFFSNPKQNGPSTSEHMSRSFSYDAKLYLDFVRDGEKKNKTHDIRYSQGDVKTKRTSSDTMKVQRWLCNGNSSREECISKLMEMKDYF